MSKIVITDKKEIKEIIKVMYEINQMYKNIYQNKGYYIYDDEEIYSYDKEQFPEFVIGYLNSDMIKTDFFKGKKFIIRGKQFYDFDPKKTNKATKEIEIDKIIYDEYDNSIEFLKELSSLRFEINILNDETYYNPYPRFHYDYYSEKDDDYENSYVIKPETLVKIKNSSDTIPIKLNNHIYEAYVIEKDEVDLKNDIMLYLNNKFIIGNIVKKDKPESYSASIETFTNNKNDNIKLAILELKTKYININNFYFHVDSRI